MRERLPDRRESHSVAATHVWAPGTAQEIHEPLLVTYSCYADGRIGEVFIDSLAEARGKLAARTTDMQKDVAVVISLALQHGATLDELREAAGNAEANLMGKIHQMPATIVGTVIEVLAAEQPQWLTKEGETPC